MARLELQDHHERDCCKQADGRQAYPQRALRHVIGLPLPVVEDMMQFGRRNVELKFLVRNASDSAAATQPAPSATVDSLAYSYVLQALPDSGTMKRCSTQRAEGYELQTA